MSGTKSHRNGQIAFINRILDKIVCQGGVDDIAQNTLKMTLFSIHSGWFMTLAEFEAFLDNFCEFVTILPGPKKIF